MTRPHFALAILLPLLFIVLSGTGFILYLAHTMKTPLHSHDTEVLFVVKPGSGFRKVAEDLENRGLIGNADLFILWAIYHKKTGSVKAGEFSLSSSMPPEQILEKLIAGKVYQHSITVPEGFNIWEIAGLWDQSGNGSKADFLANLDRYEFPGFERPDTGWEGYLFPDTIISLPALRLRH